MTVRRLARYSGGVLLTLVLALALACGTGPVSDTESAVRLVDVFDRAEVRDSPTLPEATSTKLVWERGDGGAPWKMLDADGVKVVHLERTEPTDDSDLLHAVEVAIRVEQGGELSVQVNGAEELELQRVLGSPFPWPLRTPVVPGDRVERYTLRATTAIPMERVRHVLVRPSEEPGVAFELESVRVVTRREHLASIESGIGWHGMDDIFRETIVTRAPETVSFEIDVPDGAFFDVALATVDAKPLTFAVRVEGAGDPVHVERTVTAPHGWNPWRVPLDRFAGETVTLSLEVAAGEAGALGFWGTPAVRAAEATVASRPQGVIVILADTLRSDRVGAWGHDRETAPILADLAARGTRMADTVTQATWTKVSVPAIMTSLYPSTHSVAQISDRLPASAETMAEVFRNEGYATLALTSIPFVGQFTNLHQGYEELHESASLDTENAKTARAYVDRLLPWLDRHRDVPFFVFLHVADPHSPYYPYAPYDTAWGEPGDAERLTELSEQVRPHIEDPLMQRFGMPERDELAQAGVDPEEFVDIELDAYDGSILGMDVEIGRVLERLRELGIDDRTLIAFVSDHGTEFLDHDAHFHGHTVYGELNRVPMFLHGPGVPAGVVVEDTVQTIDLMPTVLEIAGVRAPEGVQGTSLMPLIRGETSDWAKPAITEKAIMDTDLPGRSFASTSIIHDGWKLIHNDPAPDDLGAYELYDHRDDPRNMTDVAADNPEVVERLAAILDQWRAEVLAVRLDHDAATEGLDDEALERLRSLGYVQ